MRSTAQAIVLAVAALIVVGVASGCGGGSKGNGRADDDRHDDDRRRRRPAAGRSRAGAQLFSDNCESCHGPMGAGGHVGPNLQKSSVAEHLAQVETQVRHGGGAMPPFSGVLSDKEIDAVAHYVVEQIAPKG